MLGELLYAREATVLYTALAELIAEEGGGPNGVMYCLRHINSTQSADICIQKS